MERPKPISDPASELKGGTAAPRRVRPPSIQDDSRSDKLKRFSELPGVVATTIGDSEGTLIDSRGEEDAEGLAAVSSFAFRGLAKVGETLGFGEASRVKVQSAKVAVFVVEDDEHTVTMRLALKSVTPQLEERLAKVIKQGD